MIITRKLSNYKARLWLNVLLEVFKHKNKILQFQCLFKWSIYLKLEQDSERRHVITHLYEWLEIIEQGNSRFLAFALAGFIFVHMQALSASTFEYIV